MIAAFIKSRGLLYGAPIALALLTASHLWAYRSGVTRQADRQARAELVAVSQAVKTHAALTRDLDQIAERAAAAAAARGVVYRTINREVIRYVATTPDFVCWDADGLRIIRAAARGETPAAADPGQSAATVPAAP